MNHVMSHIEYSILDRWCVIQLQTTSLLWLVKSDELWCSSMFQFKYIVFQLALSANTETLTLSRFATSTKVSIEIPHRYSHLPMMLPRSRLILVQQPTQRPPTHVH